MFWSGLHITLLLHLLVFKEFLCVALASFNPLTPRSD